MVTLRRTSLLMLATLVVAAMAGGPAHAATPGTAEVFGATGAARALHVNVLGQDLTFGDTTAKVGSTLTAAATAAGQLLQAGPPAVANASGDNTSDIKPPNGSLCLPVSLPAALQSLLDTSLACSLAKASVTAGAPNALGQASVADISVEASGLLKNITDQLKLGDTVNQITSQLSPVLDAVSQATGNQVNLNNTTSTVTDLLNALTSQKTLEISLGQSTSALSTVASTVTSTSTALGGQIKLLPVAALGGQPLATITIGSAKTSASYDRAAGTSSATFDPALVTVEVGSIAGLPGQTIKVAPGQTITLLQGTPLESTISVADGSQTVDGSSAKAVADGVSLQLLKGLSLPTGGSSVTAAATGPGAVVVELAHAESQVSGTPGTPPSANPPAPPAAEVKALAFTGTSPWLPIGGMALLGAAWGTRRLRRKVTA